MLKREALEILQPEDDAELRFVSERTYDICELLRDLHDKGELRTDFREVPMTVTYHAPCQQQGHGDRQARARPARRSCRGCA